VLIASAISDFLEFSIEIPLEKAKLLELNILLATLYLLLGTVQTVTVDIHIYCQE
tara:strand:- start:19 stop:183 length:165 start_codon:yes stop_codon:yes gene_type:complete